MSSKVEHMDIALSYCLALKALCDRDHFTEHGVALMEVLDCLLKGCLRSLSHPGYRRAPFSGTIF